MKQRKTKYRWFWNGVKYGIPLCCIMFFETAWADCVKREIDEYGNKMHILTNNEGVILCPDCVAKRVTENVNMPRGKNTCTII